jgi:cell shape-determining protein MreD
MTEGTRWQFLAFVGVLVVLYFLLRVGLGLGELAPDFLVVALLLAARRLRAGWAAGLGLALGLLDGAAHPLTMGAGAVALAVLGYLAARSRDVLAGDSPILLALFLFAGKWIYDLMMWVLLLRLNLSGPVGMLGVSLLAAAYAAAVGLAAAAAYRSVA